MSPEELTVYYPSGKWARLFGQIVKHGKLRPQPNAPYRVAIECLESTMIGDEIFPPGSILLFDPCAVVRGQGSGVIYTPRPHMHDFPSETREWLEANPDWPARLEVGAPPPEDDSTVL